MYTVGLHYLGLLAWSFLQFQKYSQYITFKQLSRLLVVTFFSLFTCLEKITLSNYIIIKHSYTLTDAITEN